jgi:hypothetical protein
MIARLGAARLLAVALATVMLLWLWQATRLKYTAANGQPGPGFWPFWLTLLALALAIGAIVVETRKLHAPSRSVASTPDETGSVPAGVAPSESHQDEEGIVVEEEGRGTILRPLGAMVGPIGFMLAMPVLGFQVGLALFILYLNLVLIRMSPVLAISLTVALALIVNLAFAQFFDVPFPKSILGI